MCQLKCSLYPIQRKSAVVCLIVLIFISLFLPTLATGSQLDIDIKDFLCRDGKYVVLFGIINKFSYNQKPIVAFRVLKGTKPVACKKISVDAPTGADGSAVHEAIIGVCSDEDVILESRIFKQRHRDDVAGWFSGCPVK